MGPFFLGGALSAPPPLRFFGAIRRRLGMRAEPLHLGLVSRLVTPLVPRNRGSTRRRYYCTRSLGAPRGKIAHLRGRTPKPHQSYKPAWIMRAFVLLSKSCRRSTGDRKEIDGRSHGDTLRTRGRGAGGGGASATWSVVGASRRRAGALGGGRARALVGGRAGALRGAA